MGVRQDVVTVAYRPVNASVPRNPRCVEHVLCSSGTPEAPQLPADTTILTALP